MSFFLARRRVFSGLKGVKVVQMVIPSRWNSCLDQPCTCQECFRSCQNRYNLRFSNIPRRFTIGCIRYTCIAWSDRCSYSNSNSLLQSTLYMVPSNIKPSGISIFNVITYDIYLWQHYVALKPPLECRIRNWNPANNEMIYNTTCQHIFPFQ